jgi:MFS family permease
VTVRTRLGVFGYRDFALYWSGGLLSNVGTWLQNISASVFIYILTESPLMVGLLNFAGFLPIMAFSLFGGVVSDRFDRRRVILVTHLFSMSIAFIVAGLAFADLVAPWVLIVGAFISNTSYAFAKPSLMSLLPHLVPRNRLSEATGLNLLQFTGGQLGGSVLAAVVLATLGPAWAFLLNGFTFLGPAVAVMLLSNVPKPSPDARRTSGVAAIAAGLTYVRTSRVLLASLVGIAATSALAESLRTLSPVLASEGFNRPESDAGIIVAAWGVGSAISILSVGPLSRRFSPWHLAGAGALLHGASAVGVALAPTYAAGLGAALVLGFGYSLTFTILTARLQDESSDGFRGRVMSLHTLSHLGMRPFTAFAAGALATVLGVQLTFLVFGIVAASAFLLVGIARAGAQDAADRRPEEELRA